MRQKVVNISSIDYRLLRAFGFLSPLQRPPKWIAINDEKEIFADKIDLSSKTFKTKAAPSNDADDARNHSRICMPPSRLHFCKHDVCRWVPWIATSTPPQLFISFSKYHIDDFPVDDNSAPYKAVREALAKGTLGSLNPTPWAAMTGNCSGWIAYSYLIKVRVYFLGFRLEKILMNLINDFLRYYYNDNMKIKQSMNDRCHFTLQNQFLFWANAPGLLLSVWLNMSAVKLQYCDNLHHSAKTNLLLALERKELYLRQSMNGIKTASSSRGDSGSNESFDENKDAVKTQQQNEVIEALKKMLSELSVNDSINNNNCNVQTSPHEKKVVAIVFIWLAIVSLVSFIKMTQSQREFIVGLAVNLNLLFFYGAPLTTIFMVLKRRDSSSIHWWTMFLNTACAFFFTGFGIGTNDYFIIVINGLGVLLGVIQSILRIVVPCKVIVESLPVSSDEGAQE